MNGGCGPLSFRGADLLDASGFCPNVEWLKNRNVTLGCTSATLHCPSDPVSRLAMAAFINRLATAYLFGSGGSGGLVRLASAVRVCETPDYVVSGFPRQAEVRALVNVFASTTAQSIQMTLQYSINGGAWSSIAGSNAWHYIDTTPNNEFSVTVAGFPLNLQVGSTYRFAVGAINFAGPDGNAAIACQLEARIENRNASSSPYDEEDVRAPSPK